MSTLNGGPNVALNGLVLYLDAANSKSYISGSTIWNDISRTNNNGIVVNNPNYTTNNGGSIVFDGVNDYVNLGDVLGFNTPNFSFGAWFYFNGASQQGIILGKRNDAPFNQYNIGIQNNALNGGLGTNFTATLIPDSGLQNQFNYDLAPFGVGWYFGMITVSASSQRMYVNGQNVLTNNSNFTGQTFIIPGRPLYIGCINISNAPNVFFKSSFIPMVLIYNRTLTDEEILQIYNTTKGRFGL